MKLDESHQGQDASMCSESEGYIADDETRPGPTVMPRLKERVSDHENQQRGTESSGKENPLPEMANVTAVPRGEKPGFFSRMSHKFGHKKEVATALSKGVTQTAEVQAAERGLGSSELGTGYEEDGEEAVNPVAFSKCAEGEKPPFERQDGYNSIGPSEVGTGYEAGSEGSFSH